MNPTQSIKLLAALLLVLVSIQGSLAWGYCDVVSCNYWGCIRTWEHRFYGGRYGCYYPWGFGAPSKDGDGPSKAADACTNIESPSSSNSSSFSSDSSSSKEESNWAPSSLEFKAPNVTVSKNSVGGSSLDSTGRCVQLFSEKNCGGKNVKVDASSDSQKDFSKLEFEDKPQSLSAC